MKSTPTIDEQIREIEIEYNRQYREYTQEAAMEGNQTPSQYLNTAILSLIRSLVPEPMDCAKKVLEINKTSEYEWNNYNQIRGGYNLCRQSLLDKIEGRSK